MKHPRVTPENVNELLPDGYRLKVHHFHDGNDPNGFVRDDIKDAIQHEKDYNGCDFTPPVYASEARITKREKDAPPIVTAYAICMKGDQPSRRFGWEIAATRAYIKFAEWYNTTSTKNEKVASE